MSGSDRHTTYFIIFSTIALLLINYFNHALYHVAVETFCIFIGIMIFIMAINSREYSSRNLLLSMGVLYLYVGTLDFLHMVSIEELNVLNAGTHSNLAYWVAARVLESSGILFLFIKFRGQAQSNYVRDHIVLSVYTIVAISVISFYVIDMPVGDASIMNLRNVFEGITIVFFIIALILTHKLNLPKEKRNYLHIAISLKIISEILVFFYYKDETVALIIGSIARYVSYACFYLIFVIMTLKEPYKNVYSVYKREHDELKFLSEIDQLTGILNHSTTVHRLEALAEKYHDSEEKLFVTMVDLDDFKTVNDTYGHQKGDEVLRIFAELLSMGNYKDKVVGRYGGDEFIIAGVFIDNMDIVERFELFASRVKAKFEAMDMDIKFSAGVALCKEGDTVKDLIYKADIAMYESKRLGKNRVSVWKGE